MEEAERETERKTAENEIKIAVADAKEETYENKTKTAEMGITKFMMNVDENKIALDYDITEEARVWDIYPDAETNSLVIKLNATEKGSLAITLPRHVIDATFDDKEDDEFFVLVNEEEVDFDEIVTATNRTLIIEFPDNTDEIEIMGSFVIPEFRAIAVMVLAIAIASIITVFAKSRLGAIPRL
ncbi:PEFG-CTERM sorting domain-containing protein [archaeon]|nr:PEFG-CTERM sorting domain-containing protein [archaeon]